MHRVARVVAGAFAILVAGGSPAVAQGGDGPRPAAEVRDGPVRIQVITPRLFRLEYAADGRFEDRPSLTVVNRRKPRTPFKLKQEDGVLQIKTSRATLRYRAGSGPFSPENTTLKVKGRRAAQPFAGNPGSVSGWYRGLDGQSGPIDLHDGLISKAGWYLLDDTQNPLLTEGGRWYETRPGHDGPYQDTYLFAYGRDYAAALGDLRTLTGAAPLLPRKAFGVWFSRYFGYSAQAFKKLAGRFRSERVPLDVLVVDTDFKWPNPWNGWQWTSVFFPDPPGFIKWAHSKGLDLMLNIHPSIAVDDPSLPAAEARAGGLGSDSGACRAYPGETGTCAVWDWAQRDDVQSYFSLHEPFEAQGIDFWWFDWVNDESVANAPGLTPDTWINQLYAQRQRDRGSRWPVLSRIGASRQDYGGRSPAAFAEHRNTIHFTGDTYATWGMLGYQAEFTAAEGAGIGMPYVSHDIGGFFGKKLPPKLYARWVQLGAFQPILRMHSDHGLRLPWDYGGKTRKVASEFLRLRGSLIPYIYTAARQAHDSGMPMARAMYLQWPKLGGAYKADGQYMFGEDLLVAPVAQSNGRVRVWFPPGEWYDIFTGRSYRGAGWRSFKVPLQRMPVFARAGSVVPRRPPAPNDRAGQNKPLELHAYAGADGSFTLYEDSGSGFGYEGKEFSRTRLSFSQGADSAAISIGAAKGRFRAAKSRGYEIDVTGLPRPRRVTLGGRTLGSWSYSDGLLSVSTPKLSTGSAATIAFDLSSPPRRKPGRGGR